MTRIGAAALLGVLMLGAGGCGEDDEPATGTDTRGSTTLEFIESGGCGDAFFWTTTADDEYAVVASVDLRERSTTAPTVLEVELPDPQVEVELWKGEGLTSLMCNDVVQGEVTAEIAVVEGGGSITVQARPEGHTDFVDGKLELSGLVAENGTELPDLAIKTSSIGFYAG